MMIYFIAFIIVQAIVYLIFRRAVVRAIDKTCCKTLDAVCDSMTREFFERESRLQARTRLKNIREQILELINS
jgi:hypothetical protein